MKSFKIVAAILCCTFIMVLGMPLTLQAIDVKTLFERGMKSFNSGNYRSAELQYREIFNKDNNDEFIDRARFYLALAIFNQGKYKAAIFEFNSFMHKSSTAVLQHESRFWIGESYFHLNDYVKAIESYNRFIKKSSNQALLLNCLERIGTIYYMQRRYDEAIIEWEKYISKSSDKILNAMILIKIGDAHFQNKNYDEALKILNRIITSRNDIKILSKARLIIGRIYQIKGNHNMALITLNGIPSQLQKEEAFAEVDYFKAISNINLNKINDAKTQLRIFILIGKESRWNYNAKLHLGKILLQGEGDKAGVSLLEDVRTHAKKTDLRIEASTLLGNYYLKNDPEKAIPYLNESLQNSKPKYRKEILLLLGQIYIKLKKFNKAETTLDQFYKEFPFDNIDEISFLRARIYLEMGKYPKAVELFEKLKKENPFSKYIDEIKFYLALAKASQPGGNSKQERDVVIQLLNSYLSKGSVENKYDAYLLLFDLYIKNDDFKNVQTIIYILMNKYNKEHGIEKIIYNYVQVLQKNKINADYYIHFIFKNYPFTKIAGKLYYIQATEYFKKKDYKNAEEYFNKYLNSNLTGHKSTAYYNHLVSLFKLRKYREVVDEIKKKYKPLMNVEQWKKMQLLLGRSYFKLGEYDKVYNFMDIYRINEYGKDDQLIYLKSALVVGDIKTALDITKYMEKYKEYFAEALFHIGNFYVKSGDTETAKGFYSRIIVECSGSSYIDRARLNLAEMYINSKNYTTALNQLASIKAKEYMVKKDALSIIAYIRTKDIAKAMTLTMKNYYSYLHSEDGELVFKELVVFYYKKGDLYQFNKFARNLARYKDSVNYVNYLTGKIYFQKNNFPNAYYYFYLLLSSKSEYIAESYYYLGKIKLLFYQDTNNAINFYNKFLALYTGQKKLVIKARLDLALVYINLKKKDDSRKQLDEIMKIADNSLDKIQVQNLYEHFGFK